MSETILEFAEAIPVPYPRVIRVLRSTTSRYQFLLMVRLTAHITKTKPRFRVYSKQDAAAMRAEIEEHSVLSGKRLIALEGFTDSTLDGLRPAPDTYVVAESDTGLQTQFLNHKTRRGFLKLLNLVLGTTFTLRDLLKVDWSGTSSPEEMEGILRRAYAGGYSLEMLQQEVEGRKRQGNSALLARRGRFKELLELRDRTSAQYLAQVIGADLLEVARYKTQRMLGAEPDKVSKDLDFPFWKVKELEEAHRMMTTEDLAAIADALIRTDFWLMKNPQLGSELLLTRAAR